MSYESYSHEQMDENADQQNISTEEIVDQDYEVVPKSAVEDSGGGEDQKPKKPYRGPFTEPGRTYLDDSVEASGGDPVGASDENPYSASYESKMATRIGDEEKGYDEKTKRLREMHEGRHQHDGEHALRESQRDKKRIPQALCSSLPLSSHEAQCVVNVVSNMNLDALGYQKAIPRATLGAVVVVVDENMREERADDLEDMELVQWTDQFRACCDKHDVGMSDMSTLKQKVREALEEQSIPIQPGRAKRDPNLPGPSTLDERPDEYWEEKSAEFWTAVARSWEHQPDEFHEAVPDAYRDTVMALRQWEPWERGEEEDEPEERSTQDAPGVEEEDAEAAFEDLDEAVEAEAEAMIEEMDEERSE